MSLSASLFGRDSAIFRATNVLGLGIPGWLDKKFGPPETEGPRLSDLSIQTSTYGAEIPRIYGTVAQSGNIMWLENGKLKEKVKKNKQGGKGGGSSEPDKTYTYFATFQLGLCEGPIAGVKRIWCRDKLIYNAGSDDLETVIASNGAAKGWKLYTGTDDQMPDPRYEAEYGVGNVSAHRGLAYIAFYDFALAPYGDSLEGAQFKIEIVKIASSTPVLTSARTISFAQPFTNAAFSPRAYFVSPEKIKFYVPQWENDYPSSSSFLVYEITTGGLARTHSILVSGISGGDVPPSGDSDSGDDYWKSGRDVFGPGGKFDGPQGYLQKRSGLYVGLSEIGDRKLYAKTDSGRPDPEPITVSAACFAINGDTIYSISADGIREYDDELVLIGEHLFTTPPMLYPAARAEVVDGSVLVYDGIDQGKVYRIPSSLDGYVLLAELPAPATGSYYADSVWMSEGMLVRAGSDVASKTLITQWINFSELSDEKSQLSSIIQSEVALSGLIANSDIDVSLLESEVSGYLVTGGTIRSSLEPLATAFRFDVISSGYKIKFVPRGQPSVATINWTELGAGSDGQIITQSREMDTQLPAKTTVNYLDADREYEIGQQYSERINTEAVNKVDVELAVVMTPDYAAGVAEVIQGVAWIERDDLGFTLPPSYSYLEVADVITVIGKLATYTVRLIEINTNSAGVLECKAKPDSATLYTPSASGASGVIPPSTIGLPGQSLVLLLDIPLVDEVSQNAAGYVSAMTGYTDGWPGAVLVRSADGGQTWEDLQAYTGKGGIGYASGSLPSSPGYLIDQRSLEVRFMSGEPESITLEKLLAGYNYAAYGVNGRWEIVRFQNATLNADGSYSLSGFVRGDKGTEWATGLHVTGDYFILLDDPDNAFIGTAVQTIGLARDYRAVTSGASVDDAENTVFTYNGVNLECLSPVNARATRDGSGNLSATFVRRSRLGSTWWGNGVEAPVGETTQAYEIDVMSGSTVKRTITAATPAFSYSAANQTTDFGSAQASITFRIYQLSEIVGRGYVREVTL